MSAPRSGTRIVAKPSARSQFSSATLALEAVVVLLATAAAHGLRAVPELWPGGRAMPVVGLWAAGGSLVVVLVALSRSAGSPAGRLAGSLVQIPVLAMGVFVPMMYVLGAVFVTLWAVGLRLGSRIDRERAAYDRAHPATAPNVVNSPRHEGSGSSMGSIPS